ncbi:MAG: fused MFS/spermidine synthase [Eggerthellaceae bacterium]
MNVTVLVALVVACAAVCVAGVAFARRRGRAHDEQAVFVSYPTMFGKAHVFTVRYDATIAAHRQADDDADDAVRSSAAPTDSDANDPAPDDEGAPVWVRVLEIGGAYQAATFITDDACYDLVFDYCRLFDRLFETGIPIRRVLMLGGGGYMYPKHLISQYPDVALDVVEIDPAITALAERYFYLDRLIEEFVTERTRRLRLVNDDARHFLDELPSDVRYDAIINDCFAGRAPVASLAGSDAARLIHAHLTPGGAYLVNAIAALEGPAAAPLVDLGRTLSPTFSHLCCVPCRRFAKDDTDNVLVIATDGTASFTGAIPLPRATEAQG